ncbi:MAG TPA: hypothetical protein DEF43_16815 [Chloroflexus aurantiacus]|nr:MAG: hypothetical protein D6716_15355 [Chloroflexota bacterium]GIV92601.1 MAG: hypothetical protein KatS3mg056_1310 [Chloroflexus sp.]GIV95168.1 MAG: hypothetical protein KatS3mg056_3877 [Chloroflexus sp.]HBW68774.1 hypothetical protein [Chloroflexus aurantiacus]
MPANPPSSGYALPITRILHCPRVGAGRGSDDGRAPQPGAGSARLRRAWCRSNKSDHSPRNPIFYLLPPISYLLTPISYPLTPISYLLTPISYPLTPISYLLSPPSSTLPPISYLLYPISYLLPLSSPFY